jgi:hypothetical protein
MLVICQELHRNSIGTSMPKVRNHFENISKTFENISKTSRKHFENISKTFENSSKTSRTPFENISKTSSDYNFSKTSRTHFETIQTHFENISKHLGHISTTCRTMLGDKRIPTKRLAAEGYSSGLPLPCEFRDQLASRNVSASFSNMPSQREFRLALLWARDALHPSAPRPQWACEVLGLISREELLANVEAFLEACEHVCVSD